MRERGRQEGRGGGEGKGAKVGRGEDPRVYLKIIYDLMALTLCFKLTVFFKLIFAVLLPKQFFVIERFSITGSDVMPISPLGGAKFQIRPHILKPTSDFLLAV